MDKSTKIVVMGGVLAIGLLSQAQAAGNACSSGTGVAIAGNSASFIKDSFTPKCSTGVEASFAQSTTAVSVRSGSSKGMHTFGGTSDGGGVAQCESSSVSAPATTAATAPASATNGCS